MLNRYIPVLSRFTNLTPVATMNSYSPALLARNIIISTLKNIILGVTICRKIDRPNEAADTILFHISRQYLHQSSIYGYFTTSLIWLRNAYSRPFG